MARTLLCSENGVHRGERTMSRVVLLGTAAFGLLFVAQADAAIVGFKFLRIEGVSQELNDRIGKHSTDKTHIINYEDCVAYTGYINLYWSVSRNPVPSGTFKYAVKMSRPGGSCTTTDMSGEANESCYGVMASGDLTANGQEIKVLLSLQSITGGCAVGTDANTTVYFIVDEGASVGSSSSIASETLVFRVDQKPPNPVKIEDIQEGDQNIRVSWSDEENSGEPSVRYKVYWSKSKLTNANKGAAEGSDGPLTAKSYQITGLTNDTQYWFGVTAIDENDNESSMTEGAIGTGMPVEVADFLDVYKAAGGKEMGCTASATAGPVWWLMFVTAMVIRRLGGRTR